MWLFRTIGRGDYIDPVPPPNPAPPVPPWLVPLVPVTKLNVFTAGIALKVGEVVIRT